MDEQLPSKEQIVEEDKEISLRNGVFGLLAMKKRDQATELIVKYLYENFIFKTTKIDEKNEIWVYREGIYEPQGRCHIQEETRKILGEVYTTQIVNVIIGKVEADTFIEQDTFFNEQNEYPEIIPVQNGLLNLKTKEIKEFSSKVPYFNKLPIRFKNDAKCDKFLCFLKEIVKKEDDILIIQELFGYSPYKNYKHKKSFMLEGGGDNGKSQLLKILTEKFLGIENTKSISLAQMEKDTYLMGELHNKLVNVSADITQDVINDSGNFKNLTGNDPISLSRKFKNSITIINYAKMIFATNELPISKDNSSGFWGRWVLLEFPNKFLPQKEYDILSDKERISVKIAIPNIIDTIIDEEELSGILNWALIGFERLENNKEFSYNKSREETKNKWLKKANSVLAFISENIDDDYDSYITKKEFKQSYLRYCKEHKLKAKSDKVINISLENEVNAFSERKYVNEQQQFIWSGIKFKQKLDRLDRLVTFSKPKEKTKIPHRSKTTTNVSNVSNVKTFLEEKQNRDILTIDELRKFIEYFEDFSYERLDLELSEKFSFNENQLENYIKKLKEEGYIFESKPNLYKKL